MVSECLRSKRKDIAMTHLRAKKQLEETLQHRLGALENLHSTLIQVEQAAQNIDLMKQYESSTATLRSILSHPSLQRETIDETMEAMAAATAEHRDIDDAIRVGAEVAHGEVFDEGELEAELAGLVEEVREEREKDELRQVARVEGALPNVPLAPPVHESGAERPEFVPLPLSSTNISSDGMSDTRSPNASETVPVMSQ